MRNDERPETLAYRSIRRRLWLEWTLVALFASTVVFGLVGSKATDRIDNIVYDNALDSFQPKVTDRILLVTIDDASIRQLGRWPWSRDLHAQLIQYLHTGGAKAIAYDVLFPETADPAGDNALADAMRLGTPVIIPQAYSVPGLNGAPYDVVRPLPELSTAANAVGHVSLAYDSDGVVRKIPLSFGEGQDRALHMMEQLYRLDQGRPSRLWERSDAPDHNALIAFQSDIGIFPTISFSSVLEGEVPAALIRDKLVLVGAAASGLGDIHPTPTGEGGTVYGVELMANVLNAMELNQSIRTTPPYATAIMSIIPLAILLISFWFVRPRTTLLIALGLIVLILLVTTALLALGFWIPPSPALAGVALVYPLWGWRRLQAMDDFVGRELARFTSEDNILLPPRTSELRSDYIGERSYRLEYAISAARSLRRFVSDILEQLPDPMILVDSRGRVRLANEGAQELFGEALYQEQAINLLREVAIPEDRHHFDTLAIEHDENQRTTFQSRAGRSYEIRSLLVRADDGELRGLLYYLADVTGQKRAAEEREELLQLLIHDMRSPQSSILALLDGVPPKKLANADYGRLRQYARRTLTLADNFVHLARLKGTDFEPEFVDLADIVQEAADELYTLAQKRGIHIAVTRKDVGEYWVMGEPGTLHRAFCNLFDNAVKHSPDKTRITASLSHHGALVRCELADQGAGIDPDLAGHLFDRFAKGEGKTGAPSHVVGTGLGLNFVLSVVERHAGQIWAENKESGGACFVIELPVADDDMLDEMMLADAR